MEATLAGVVAPFLGAPTVFVATFSEEQEGGCCGGKPRSPKTIGAFATAALARGALRLFLHKNEYLMRLDEVDVEFDAFMHGAGPGKWGDAEVGTCPPCEAFSAGPRRA